jgi:hypothetical protein
MKNLRPTYQGSVPKVAVQTVGGCWQDRRLKGCCLIGLQNIHPDIFWPLSFSSYFKFLFISFIDTLRERGMEFEGVIILVMFKKLKKRRFLVYGV